MQISASTVAQPNTAYEINGTGTATIDVTLPGNPAVGDFVSVRGVSANPWRVLPGWAPQPTARSQVLPFSLSTTNLAGNAPAGVNWTPRMDPKQWHWVASDALGSVLVAADIPGNLWLSLDAGATWSATNSPGGQAWVSVSINRTPSAPDPLGMNALQIVAVAYGGGMYRYAGGSWTAVASTDPSIDLSNREWESVSVDPGGGIVGAILNGPIYCVSGTSTVAATAEGSTTPLVRGWRAVARGNGAMVAASQDGEVWISTTAGRTWTQRNVVVAGTTVIAQWYRAAISDDGNTIAVAGRFDTGMYISRDRGATWAQTPTPVGDYTAIAMSADARVIGATITNGATASTTGSVQLSRDGGATFAPLALPGSDHNWRAISLSADGNMMAVAAGTFGAATGQLYTSLGNRTSYPDVPGFIGAGQGAYVEVEYLGNQQYRVRSSSAGPFTIR